MATAHTITTTNLGRRGHMAATVHGPENEALPAMGGFLSNFAAFFPKDQPKHPYFCQKVFLPTGTTPSAALAYLVNSGVAANIKNNELAAKRAGYTTILQLRDDEAGGRGDSNNTGRSTSDAIELCTNLLDAVEAQGFLPDLFHYGNEPEINNAALSVEDHGQKISDIYGALFRYDMRFAVGGVADWHALARYLPPIADTLPDTVSRRIGLVHAHQYGARPDLPVELLYDQFVNTIFPGVPLISTENDWTFTASGNPLQDDLWSEKGAVYTVYQNLALAHGGIHCGDYTVQTARSGINGNGMFKSDQNPHPSGAAMRDIVGPFLKHPMLKVTRDTWDSTAVYANNQGEIIALNFPTDKTVTVPNWLRQSAYGNDFTHLVLQDIVDWLNGVGPQPSYAPLWEPDWDALQDAWDTAIADSAAATRSVTATLPVSRKKFTPIKTLFGGDTTGYAAGLTDPTTFGATLPKYSLVYGKLTG